MIKSIAIENFKAIGPMSRIPFKPITLIFGPNSAGKSTLLQSLLLLKQSLNSGSGKPLTANSDLVKLGGYRDFIHKHEKKRKLSFKFEIDEKAFLSSVKDLSPILARNYSGNDWEVLVQKMKKTLNGENVFITIKFAWDTELKTTIVDGFDFRVGELHLPVMEYTRSSIPDIPGFIGTPNPQHTFWKRFGEIFKKELCGELSSQDPGNPFNNLIALYEKIVELNEKLDGAPDNENIRKERDNLIHQSDALRVEINTFKESYALPSDYASKKEWHCIESLKFLPEYTSFPYVEVGKTGSETFGQNKINATKIKGAEDENIYSSDDFIDPTFFLNQASVDIAEFIRSIEHIKPLRNLPKRFYSKSEDANSIEVLDDNFDSIFYFLENESNLQALNDILSSVGIKYKLSLKNYEEVDDDLYAIEIINTMTGVKSGLNDVGVGISQVLPIVIACMSAKDKNVLVEQPELHLHPKAQTELGDLFINSAIPKGNRFIIETHSEHLILRLLRRIRETEADELPEGCEPITPDDVMVLYAEPEPDGVNFINLPIDTEGSFTRPWPHGFFDERAGEIF